MQFTCSVEINRPLGQVVQLFSDPNNLKEWQDDFIRIEHLSGTPGEVGATSKMVYKMGKGEMELIETILVNNLPHEFSGNYVHEHMTNDMRNHFTALSDTLTRWDAHIEYTHFKNIFIQFIMYWMAKKPQKWLNQFRDFAERQDSRS